ncbi:unnamed protein product [Sphagnum balticum]
MKEDLSYNSNNSLDFISEKDLLQQIYERIYEEKASKAKVRRDQPMLLTALTNQKKEIIYKEVQAKILSEDYEAVRKGYSLDQVTGAIQPLYEEGRIDFNRTVNLLDELGVGDGRKIEIGRLCKIYKGDISDEDLRRIFPFNFFLEH